MTLILDNCTYRYRRWSSPVLSDFSYEVQDGLTILLGPNGAGKSTLLRLAASVVRPQSGKVALGDISSESRQFRRAVAWMPQEITPIPTFTAREYVAYVGWLKGMSRGDAWSQARQVLERVGLRDKCDTRTSRLSGGQLRRVGIASALVHGARVLLLDEPTAGLDPHQRRVFREILRDLTDGIQVLVSTHDIIDLEEDAEHVTVLHGGRIRYSGDKNSFLAHSPADALPGRAPEQAYSAILAAHGLE
ncbi:ATP-binding cassette domain-containing protein [Streptomyces sp. NPDC007808]|uniref:ATP-binding cassette domain-containing protein n=1 Tax=Streptomyces sp. NPDC007808 TaxID=3364779 RepID=UPI0036882B1F